MKVTMLSARAVCVGRLVSTDDSRTERLRKLLAASNSRRYIACTHQGSIQRVGTWNFPPPPSHNFPYPEFLKLNMVIILAIYMLLNLSMCHQNVRKFLSQIASEVIWEVYEIKLFLGEHAPRPHTTIILLPSCSPPPAPQLKILYEKLCILYPAIIDVCRLPKEMNTATE